MRLLAVTVFCLLSPIALAERALEPVLHITADNAESLLGTEGIVYISNHAAEALLGDPDDSLSQIDHLNNLPATAAGPDRILMINADQAEKLLGDHP